MVKTFFDIVGGFQTRSALAKPAVAISRYDRIYPVAQPSSRMLKKLCI
jgi:hypothetical protein